VRKPLIAGLTLGVLLSLAAFRAVDLWWWRTQTVKVAAARAGNLAFILSQYIHEMFVAADASLRHLSLHSQRIGGPHAPDAEWAPSLASANAGLTGVGSISVLDADGVIRHSTQPAIVGQSRRDQYIFKTLMTYAGDDFVIDTPFRMVVEPKEFVIPVGRRLTTKEGRFDGIVVITILPAAPREFFRTIDIGPRDMLWVFHPDGFILFREPSTAPPTGEHAIGNPIFEAAMKTGAPGVIQSAGTPDGPVMLTAYHVGPRPHLFVAVSLDRSTLLADWRRQAVGSAVLFVVLGLLLIGTLSVLFRQMDARRRVESELAVARQLESARLTDVNSQLANALAAEQRARLEAEASGRLKDEFLMTVSHELRTPLTAIYGWARMLVAGTLTEDQQQTALQTIERNVQMQARLVDDLLDVSRGIGGELRLDLRTVSPADIVRQAVETVRPAAQAKDIRIETVLDPDSGTIVCDPERLLQIVWNLLSNAIKFTRDGGCVEVFLARTAFRIELVVHDTGAGISPEFLPYVFERFRQAQTGPTRLYGGLGLGLAIVRHLVELHGGSVTASSDGEGCGATFRVELPIRAQPPLEADTPPAAGTGASPRPHRS
jgi:signal transduction histidine kinase